MHPLLGPWKPPVLNIPLPNGYTLPLHGFGFLVALGFIFGSRAAMDRAKRMGLDPEVINRLVGRLVLGTFIGGHLGYGIMYKPEEYWTNLIDWFHNPSGLPEVLKVWEGLSSFGGFVVCIPIAVHFFWQERKPIWPFLDCLAYGMGIGWFFGRMGCFVAHDHPGTMTHFWLGVYGICPPANDPSVACHDLGFYEGLWSLAMFGVMWLMDRRAWKPGTLVLTYGLTYGPLRFFMDFFRPELTDARYGGFTPAQYGSALLTVVCLAALISRLRSADAPVQPQVTAEAAPAA